MVGLRAYCALLAYCNCLLPTHLPAATAAAEELRANTGCIYGFLPGEREREREGGFVFNERSCNGVARCFVSVNMVLVCTL